MEKSGWGNNIYLFLKINFFYSSIFSKLVSTHTDSIEASLNVFGLLEVSLFLVIQLESYKIETVHYRGRGSNQEISLF